MDLVLIGGVSGSGKSVALVALEDSGYYTVNNLPVSMMFSGRYGDEATLFRLAAQIEQAQPWIQRKPPVWN